MTWHVLFSSVTSRSFTKLYYYEAVSSVLLDLNYSKSGSFNTIVEAGYLCHYNGTKTFMWYALTDQQNHLDTGEVHSYLTELASMYLL